MIPDPWTELRTDASYSLQKIGHFIDKRLAHLELMSRSMDPEKSKLIAVLARSAIVVVLEEVAKHFDDAAEHGELSGRNLQ